jgi:hypothetical protein
MKPVSCETKECVMIATRSSILLRRVLAADAAISAACGILMAVGAEFLANMLGLPATLLFYAGIALLPWAALVGYLASREYLPRPVVWAVIGCNIVWAVDCALLIVSGVAAPTLLGYGFVIVQAVTVLVLAEIQYFGLRRSAPVAV